MMRIQTEVVVTRKPEEVFAYLADIENEARWNPWAIQVEKISEGPIGAGSRFRGLYKRFGAVEQELRDYVPPRSLTYLSNTMGEAKMRFMLEPAGSGTSVQIIGEADPPGLMRLLDPLMGMMMRSHFRDLAAGIKKDLETAS